MSATASTSPLREALRLMMQALEILDREKAPAEIGGHLDLAIERLKEALRDTGPI